MQVGWAVEQVTDVSEFTESPEIMDGRVKTLHPRVHGGILMRDNGKDEQQVLRYVPLLSAMLRLSAVGNPRGLSI